MNFLRRHWFDIGFALAWITGAFLVLVPVRALSVVLWLNLMALFLHQFEEYRCPGYFPGMMNSVMFSSRQPDRYPLNAQTALIVNVAVGWVSYGLAAAFAGRAVWLGIAAVLVSAGNVAAHTVLFNLKGKTRYNPGMLTAVLLFWPIVVAFVSLVIRGRLAAPLDWGVGIGLGIALNILGIFKVIDWLKDENTPYVFPPRALPLRLRGSERGSRHGGST